MKKATKFRVIFTIGIFIGGMLSSFGGLHFYSKKMNNMIVEKINRECPIISDERKLDSLVRNPQTKELFLHFTLTNELGINNFHVLFSPIDTTFFTLLTEKEKNILLRENIFKVILFSNEGKILVESLDN